jgi:hydroxymethylbilane synthase
MTQEHIIRLGTRGSDLALWQTHYIRDRLTVAWPDRQFEVTIISTRGDQILDTPLPLIGGKGLFTAELEAALRAGRIDLAVHSLKDLPTESPESLAIGAIPVRANVADALVSRSGAGLDTLPHSAVIGTSSTRRAAQILARRPDLQMHDIRGNVPTRVRKALDPAGPYDAAVLAAAGLTRLEMQDAITEQIPLDVMLPAPGQGALAVQCRDDAASLALLEPVNHRDTRLAVTAERGFLAGLGGGCSVPVAAYAHLENGRLHLRGRVSAPDGRQQIDVQAVTSDPENAWQMGHDLAQTALAQGADELLT